MDMSKMLELIMVQSYEREVSSGRSIMDIFNDKLLKQLDNFTIDDNMHNLTNKYIALMKILGVWMQYVEKEKRYNNLKELLDCQIKLINRYKELVAIVY